ncbi:MAG: 30S ribosomal protein S6--L-glutamate ligase, partial [Sulfurimonadaceae bacterium]
RSNLHQGGSAVVHKLTRKEKSTAIAAAKAMGLGVCGVDMIPSARGPLVMEVNSSPGLEGIEKATGIDIAGKIMDYIERKVTPYDGTTKRKRGPIDKIGT